MDTEERTELLQFNAAVRLWSDRFSPDRVRRFAAVMGYKADRLTHTHFFSYADIARAYKKQFKRPISRMTVWRYLDLLEENGIIFRENRKWGSNAEYPGAQRNNLYTINFDRVLSSGTIYDHDFYGAVTMQNDTRE